MKASKFALNAKARDSYFELVLTLALQSPDNSQAG
jgi:hypothetical protein